MHYVALIDQSDAGSAGDRGGNRRVVELGFRIIDRRLIPLNLRFELRYRGALRVDLLFWSEIPRRQIGETLQVEFRVSEVRLVLYFFGDRLIVSGLKWSRIDLRQEIASLDVLTFGEGNFHQFAIDPSLDRDRVECLHRAQTSEVDRHIAPFRR